ncbi:MAG: hypothetical protein MUC50_23600, partial [Myxococcota bacterium]|nr:hypothetical protein [Myxococcota bacterium]
MFGIHFLLMSLVFLFSCDTGYYSTEIVDEDDSHQGSVDDSVDDSGTDDAGTDTESETTETDSCGARRSPSLMTDPDTRWPLERIPTC